MITVCWAAKGGSGTTVVAAAMAIAASDSDVADRSRRRCAGRARHPRARRAGRVRLARVGSAGVASGRARGARRRARQRAPAWPHCAGAADAMGRARRRGCAASDATSWSTPDRRATRRRRSCAPPTTHCSSPARATSRSGPLCGNRRGRRGVVLVDEPGRALRARDIEASLGVPVVATVLLDPAIARAVDAGLLLARLPTGFRNAVRLAA